MHRPALVGILNITPDSFSGDGKLAGGALVHAAQLVAAGADILDLGAESTRPGAVPLSAATEWARLEPVLAEILAQAWRPRVRLSVDTRHAETASRALDLGVEIINDVSGLAAPMMAEILEEHACDVVVMHALDVPVNPAHTLPPEADAVAEILRWKQAITAQAAARNIAPHRLIYDPGLGFGKTAEQSLALVRRAVELKQSGGRWFFGHSRKSFLRLLGEDRDVLTLQLSRALAAAGIDYLRVHDVAAHVAQFDAAP